MDTPTYQNQTSPGLGIGESKRAYEKAYMESRGFDRETLTEKVARLERTHLEFAKQTEARITDLEQRLTDLINYIGLK